MIKLAPLISRTLSLIQTNLDELIRSKGSQIRKALAIFSFLAITLISICIIWVNTPFGVNISHDSLFYLSAAENFTVGRGIFWAGSGGELKPLTHFPPLYPLILAVVSRIGFSINLSARLIAACLFGFNIGLIGFVLYKFTQRIFISVLGSSLLMVSPVLVETHLKAMSEPVFFLTSIASFTMLAFFINQPRRSFFVLAVSFSAIAYLSRYSGIAVLATSFLSLLMLGKRSFKVKVRDAFVFVGLASLPMLLWMIRNMLLTGSTTNRGLNIHLINSDTLRQFLDTIFYWFSPKLQSHWLEVVLLSIVFVISAAFAWRQIRRYCETDCRGPYLAIILLVFSVVYVVFLMVSLSFFDASTRISNRILSPVFLAFVFILMLTMSYSARKAWQLFFPAVFLVILFIGPLPYMAQQTNQMLTTMQSSGAGFSSLEWRNSQLIQWIESLDGDPIIVTNQAMVVHYLTKIPAYQLPERFDPVKAEVRADYEQKMQGIRALLMEPNSFMVLFERRDLSAPADADLIEGLELAFTAPDGWVYVSKERGDSLPSP